MAKLLQTICTNSSTLFWSLSNSLAERIKEVSRARVLIIIVSKAGKISVTLWSFASSSIIILFLSCLLILVYSKPSGKCMNCAEWNLSLNPKQFPKCKFFPFNCIECHHPVQPLKINQKTCLYLGSSDSHYKYGTLFVWVQQETVWSSDHFFYLRKICTGLFHS